MQAEANSSESSAAPSAHPFDRALDCTGDLCPMPIYKASRALAELEPGQILQVTCTDPGSKRDFPAFASQARHQLLAAEQVDSGVHLFYLRKGQGS